MSIALVSSEKGLGGDFGTTIVSTARAHTAGNQLIVFTRQSNGTITGITDTAGGTYTFIAGINSTGVRMEAWVCNSTPGHAANILTAQMSINDGFKWITVHEISGLPLLDREVGAGRALTSNVISSAPFSTTRSQGIVLAASSDGFSIFTPGTGYTLIYGDLNGYGGVIYKILTGLAAGDVATLNANTSGDHVILTIVVTEGASTGSNDIKITQEYVEVFTPGSPALKLTQLFVEVFVPTNPPVKLTQVELEVYKGGSPPVNITQEYIEVWYIANLSGIYFINKGKSPRHDTYNGPIEVKIPDPTIRIAALGD